MNAIRSLPSRQRLILIPPLTHRPMSSSSTKSRDEVSREALKQRFLNFEKEFNSGVNLDVLSESERAIHEAHNAAISRGHYSYDDPLSGFQVMTRMIHFYRARCCGNACRHCIYIFENAPEELKAGKRFNSAYWTSEDD